MNKTIAFTTVPAGLKWAKSRYPVNVFPHGVPNSYMWVARNRHELRELLRDAIHASPQKKCSLSLGDFQVPRDV